MQFVSRHLIVLAKFRNQAEEAEECMKKSSRGGKVFSNRVLKVNMKRELSAKGDNLCEFKLTFPASLSVSSPIGIEEMSNT